MKIDYAEAEQVGLGGSVRNDPLQRFHNSRRRGIERGLPRAERPPNTLRFAFPLRRAA